MLIETVHELIVQCFLIIVPIVMYGAKSQFVPHWRGKYWFTTLMTVTLILTMTFPIRCVEGTLWDLREVPMIIGTLYGGPVTALLLFIVFAIYRFLLGGVGLYGALLVNSLMMATLLLLAPKYQRIPKQRRTLITASLSLGTAVVMYLSSTLVFHYNPPNFVLIIGLLAVVQTASVVFLTYLAETFTQVVRLQHTLEKQKAEKSQLHTAMAAGVAHQLRNPMTVIKGFLELMNGSECGKDKQREYILESLEGIQQCQSVIDDYLFFAEIDHGNHATLRLTEELHAVRDTIEPLAMINNVKLDIEVEEPVVVYGVSLQLKLTLMNLCKNAIEAMPQGGTLTVVARPSSMDYIVISIEDTGHGMTPEQIAQLGKPFYSLKTKGIGLGTMLAYRIIESMAGRIECQSMEGKGTIFTIYIPKFSDLPKGGGHDLPVLR